MRSLPKRAPEPSREAIVGKLSDRGVAEQSVDELLSIFRDRHSEAGSLQLAGLEARIAHLEASAAYLQKDVAQIRTDVREVRERLHRLQERTSHLPSTGMLALLVVVILVVVIAASTFQQQMQAVVYGVLSGI